MANQPTLHTAATVRSESAIASHKVLRNTYLLLSMTLLFSAITAGAAMALNLPHPGFIISLVVMAGGLLAVQALRNSDALCFIACKNICAKAVIGVVG